MVDNVIPIDGNSKVDIPFEQVLDDAKDIVNSGIVIGWDEDGAFYFASSGTNGAEINWLIDKAKHVLMNVISEEV